MSIHVEPLFDSRTQTLTYVVSDTATGDAVVIDAVLDFDPAAGTVWTESVDAVIAYVERAGLRVHYALETHAHADHLSAGQILRSRLGARTAIGAGVTRTQATFRAILDLPPSFPTDGSQFDRLLAAGETLLAGSLRVEVIATPGHTPGCVSYFVEDAVFTGDALFVEDYGTGRCDFPDGDAAQLYESVQRLYALPPSTRVFPAHDYLPGGRPLRTETTIGRSRAENVQLSATTTKDAFVAMRRARDATLAAPRLLYPSVQVNIAGGRLPEPSTNQRRYLRIPLRVAPGIEALLAAAR